MIKAKQIQRATQMVQEINEFLIRKRTLGKPCQKEVYRWTESSENIYATANICYIDP